MGSTDVFALQSSDLNGFLFADVGVEASGMTLSVFSTLARLGLDPWQEAGRLASLPRAAAADALARAIAGMPATRWTLTDAAAIASRLVALLPPHGKRDAASAGIKQASAGMKLDRVQAAAVAILAALLLISALSAVWQHPASPSGAPVARAVPGASSGDAAPDPSPRQ